MVDEVALRAGVAAVEHPDLRRSLGELGMVRELDVPQRGDVTVQIGVAVPGSTRRDQLHERVFAAATAFEGVGSVTVEFVEVPEDELIAAAQRVRGGPKESTRPGASGNRTRIITISSGKGGVGKSSVTTNLAVALAQGDRSVGVIDADVWGFSIPKMLGVGGEPAVFGDMLVPPEAYGVRAISMDYFVPPDQAVVWRGPMLHKALEQFLGDVFWDDPEFLLVDMPPGTGDVAISISQFVPGAQSIVVTTPQPTAQRVAKRAALMAEKVNQEVMGVVENMSWFTGDDGTRYELFGAGGGKALAEELGVPLLAQIPLLPAMREAADAGEPVVVAAPDSEPARAFADLATAVAQYLPKVRTHPDLVIR